MNSAMRLDLRRKCRWPAQRRVSWGVENHAEGEGELIDSSTDGMFIALPNTGGAIPRRGDEVSVVVYFDDHGYMVDGRVRWVGEHVASRRFGMGIAVDACSAYEAEAVNYELMPATRSSGVFRRIDFDE